MADAAYDLTEQEIAFLAEIQRDMEALQHQRNGALRLMLKTRGLEGSWSLQGNHLVQAPKQEA